MPSKDYNFVSLPIGSPLASRRQHRRTIFSENSMRDSNAQQHAFHVTAVNFRHKKKYCVSRAVPLGRHEIQSFITIA